MATLSGAEAAYLQLLKEPYLAISILTALAVPCGLSVAMAGWLRESACPDEIQFLHISNSVQYLGDHSTFLSRAK